MFTRILLVLFVSTTVGGCFWGDEFAEEWATRGQIRAAAARCGIPDFEPTKAGDALAAYVSDEVPDHAAKEDCIYADLERQGRRATR